MQSLTTHGGLTPRSRWTLLLIVLLLLHPCFHCNAVAISATAATAKETNTNESSSPPDDKNTTILQEEEFEIGYGMSLTVEATPLYESQSQYQLIQVYKSVDYQPSSDNDEQETDAFQYEHEGHYGKILVLDGCVQLTERDASSYNEMMAHVPMMEFYRGGDGGGPRRVLVIGGGDGYVVREILKYKSVQKIDLVELDSQVLTVSKTYFPQWTQFLHPEHPNHHRVQIHTMDGATFVQNAASNTYDVIVQDSADPFYLDEHGEEVRLPSEVLFSKGHFGHLQRILVHGDGKEGGSGGILALQAETYNIPSSLQGIRTWRRQCLHAGFASVRYGTIPVSSYPTGQIGFLLARKSEMEMEMEKKDWLEGVREKRLEGLRGGTLHYHARLQRSCFDLPLWVEKFIYKKDEDYTQGDKDESDEEQCENDADGSSAS